MTTQTLTRRVPALVLTIVVVAAATVALALSVTGGSDAATAKPGAAPAPAAAVQAAPEADAPAAAAAPVRADDRSDDAPGQMYLDDTETRRGNLIFHWDRCLVANGARWAEGREAPMAVPSLGDHAARSVAEPIPAAAKAACTELLPQLPREQNPSLNPDYAADSEANVQCLRDAGITVHTIRDTSVFPDGLAWTYDTDHTPTPDNQAEIERTCTLESFGG